MISTKNHRDIFPPSTSILLRDTKYHAGMRIATVKTVKIKHHRDIIPPSSSIVPCKI